MSSPFALSVARWCGKALDFCFGALILFLPLFFLPSVSDVLETSKQAFLICFVSLIGLVWAVRGFVERSFRLRLHWLHGVAAIYLAFLLISTFTSQAFWQSMVGLTGSFAWPFATQFAFGLLFFFYTQEVRTTATLYNHVFLFLCSSLILSILGLFQLFGIFLLPFAQTAQKSFAFVGSPFALTIYLVPSLILAAVLTLHRCKEARCALGHVSLMGVAARMLVWISLVVQYVFLFLVDYWAAWLILLAGLVFVTSFVLFHARSSFTLKQFIVPGVMTVFALLFLLVQTPVRLSLPAEVSPNARSSWDISRATLQNMAVFGSGPATWALNYQLYRSPLVNTTPFWQMRFDQGFSSFFTLLATIGLAGVLAFIALFVAVFSVGIPFVYRKRAEDDGWFVRLAFLGGIVALMLSFVVYPLGLSHVFLLWMLLAGFVGSLPLREYRFAIVASWSGALAAVLPGVLFLYCVGWPVLALRRVQGEQAFSRAVTLFQQGKPIEQVIGELERAEALFANHSAYQRNLSQAYLIQAGNILATKPTADQTKQVEELLKKTVAVANDVTQAMPALADNWVNKAVIHQRLASAVKGYDQEAITAYQMAKTRDPNNPVHDTEIGRLYLLRADVFKALTKTDDATKRQEAQQQLNQVLEQAKTSLMSALKLKPDYFPAHYHLGIVYERMNKLPEAIVELEQVMRADNKNVGIAFELAILYYRDQQQERAIKLMEQVVAFDPKQVNARWYLASMYIEKDMSTDALTQLELLSRQLPDNQAVKQRLEQVKMKIEKQGSLPDPLPETDGRTSIGP